MSTYAGVEIGGTKCVCAFGSDSVAEWQVGVFPTAQPDATLARITAWFGEIRSRGATFDELGVACFGPLDLEAGVISAATPKVAWRGVEVLDRLQVNLGVPVRFDLDVNCAALSELRRGAGEGLTDILYLTVGTGIGVGAIVGGRLVHGTSHPEMGHMRIPLHPADRDPTDPSLAWGGNCVVHGNCWEGVGSGPAMTRREESWRALGLQPPDSEMLATEYLALGLANLVACYRPERIVVGGGVASQPSRLAGARRKVREILDEGYFPEAARLDELLVAPGLGDAAGVFGAVLLTAAAGQGWPEQLPLDGLIATVDRELKATRFRT